MRGVGGGLNGWRMGRMGGRGRGGKEVFMWMLRMWMIGERGIVEWWMGLREGLEVRVVVMVDNGVGGGGRGSWLGWIEGLWCGMGIW